jgi:hypothetical protein
MAILFKRQVQMNFDKNLMKIAEKTYLPFSLLEVEGGLPKGVLIELSGAAGGGKIEVLLRFLSENLELQAAWVEEGSTVYPCAFPQHGVGLERLLFVNAEPLHSLSSPVNPLVLDCAHQILRSQIFGALVLLPHTTPATPRDSRSIESRGCFGEIELRRLQIAAEKSGTTVFILRETPSQAHTWPLTLQLHVQREAGVPRVTVLKYKSAPGRQGAVAS